jgi:hypothetical protein
MNRYAQHLILPEVNDDKRIAAQRVTDNVALLLNVDDLIGARPAKRPPSGYVGRL